MSARKWNVGRTVDGRVLLFVERADGLRREVTPTRSQRVWNHSPDGFECGYGGSGPAQLALAILLDYLDSDPGLSTHAAANELAVKLHQHFKFEYVAPADQGFEITEAEIDAWRARHA